jgi:hypothetical protein
METDPNPPGYTNLALISDHDCTSQFLTQTHQLTTTLEISHQQHQLMDTDPLSPHEEMHTIQLSSTATIATTIHMDQEEEEVDYDETGIDDYYFDLSMPLPPIIENNQRSSPSQHTITSPLYTTTPDKTVENDNHHASLSFTSSISSALDIDNNCSNKSNYELNSTVNTVQTDNITIESEDDLYSDIVHTNNSDSDIDTESNTHNNTYHTNNNTNFNIHYDSTIQIQNANDCNTKGKKRQKRLKQRYRTRQNNNKHKNS